MSNSEPPGELVGVGRAADVYAIGNGQVLRRTRYAGYDSVPEATIMRHLAAHGFPVPEVFDADGTDLVMERLDGRDMLIDLGQRPWLVRKHARVLAEMHNALHQIEAPAGMRHLFGPGNRVMHLDLHPANIMLTSRGPYVIDWPNAAAGPGGADVAMAYLIMASSEADGVPVMVRPLVGRSGPRSSRRCWRPRPTIRGRTSPRWPRTGWATATSGQAKPCGCGSLRPRRPPAAADQRCG